MKCNLFCHFIASLLHTSKQIIRIINFRVQLLVNRTWYRCGMRNDPGVTRLCIAGPGMRKAYDSLCIVYVHQIIAECCNKTTRMLTSYAVSPLPSYVSALVSEMMCLHIVIVRPHDVLCQLTSLVSSAHTELYIKPLHVKLLLFQHYCRRIRRQWR